MNALLTGLLLVLVATSHVVGATVATTAPIPPPMTRRAIVQSKEAVPGTITNLSDGGTNFTLFVPAGWRPATSVVVAVHFHTAPWFTIQEHLRRGVSHPLVCFDLGQGSTTYRLAFEDTN